MVRRHRHSRVQVLRIPADGSSPYITTVNTRQHDDDDLKIPTAKTEQLEASLWHVPDLYRYRELIDLHHRELFNRNLDVGSDGRSWAQEYHIYKCINEKKTGLPKNKHFDGVSDARVYGDAFVFNVEKVRLIDDDWKAVFGEMEEFKDSLRREGWAWELLGQMAAW